MLKLQFKPVKETKTCYVYQYGERGNADFTTLYLKKAQIQSAGISPDKGIEVTVEEAKA